jgi:predicted transcriptional regulator of viral defense system
MIAELRRNIETEEFDYNALLSCLSGYRAPRDKITALLRAGEIIRVKKGLYVFGSAYSRRPFSKEILANLIYGPSYVSLEWALSYYGLIPERAETVTSITSQKNKLFTTPVGVFGYRHLHPAKYSVGISRTPVTEKHYFLMATPEKALADTLALKSNLFSEHEFERLLFEDMRVDIEELKKIKFVNIKTLTERYRHVNVDHLDHFIRRLK